MNLLLETAVYEPGKDMFYFANALAIILIALVIVVIILAFFGLFIRWFSSYINKDERYNLVEVGALRQIAEKIGIDMNYEKKLIDIQNGRTFRRRLEEKIIEDIFGNEEKKKMEKQKKE